MELKEIACVTGKPGLYRVLKPMRNGILVESLDAHKKKLPLGASAKVAILQEITFYTDDAEGAYPLVEVLYTMKEKYGAQLPVHHKESSDEEVMAFFAEVLPQYSRERVFASDVRKLLKWYEILLKEVPSVLERPKQEGAQEEKNSEENEEKPKRKRSTNKAKAAKADEPAAEEALAEEVQPKKKATRKRTAKNQSEGNEE